MGTTAGILIIGDEILSGKFAEENARFLIPELRSRGIQLVRVELIRDHVGDIAEAVSRMARSCDVVLTSGGVGPTHDDLTIEGVAAGLSADVVAHPALVELLRNHYGDKLNETHLRLARVPEGAEILSDEHTRWPVIRIRNVHILPGVPKYFRSCFRVIAKALSGTPPVQARVFCRTDETHIALALGRIASEHSAVAIGSYPRLDETEYSLLLTLESSDGQAVALATAALVEVLGDVVVRVEPPSAPEIG